MVLMGLSPSDPDAPVAARIEMALRRCLDWSHQGRHRKVLAEIERHLALVGRDSQLEAQLLIWKAQALLAMGFAQRALPAASRSWKLESSPHACHLMASALHSMGDSKQAEELLQIGWKLFDDAIHLPMQLAMILADQGRLRAALDVLDQISPVSQLPEDMQVFLVGLRANLLATVGRWSEADEVLREGLGRHPDSPLLLETHDSLNREWSRRQAEQELERSWLASLVTLDGVELEVDETIVRCGSVLDLPELVVLAARRLWRAYLNRGPVRLQSPEAWGTALVAAALQLDGRWSSVAAMARAMASNPNTVRSVVRRLRAFVKEQDPELARRAFASLSNPRLDEPLPAPSSGAEVVRFPGR
jgi:tetratricopeptide (TPR) repeat protein